MSRELLQRALDALESLTAYPGRRAFSPLIAEMRAALATPAPVAQPEPIAWQLPGTDSIITNATKVYRGVIADRYTIALYAAPAPLTVAQRYEVGRKAEIRMCQNANLAWRDALITETERAHGITGDAS